MNIRPLSLRDGIPAVSFSHEYDEDDKRYVNVAYVVVDANDRPLVPHGMSYEDCQQYVDYLHELENYDPADEVIDVLDVHERLDGKFDVVELRADGKARIRTLDFNPQSPVVFDL